MRHLIPSLRPAETPSNVVPFGYTEPVFGRTRPAAQVWIRVILNLLLVLSLGSVVLGVLHQAVSTDEFIFLHGIHRAANDEPLGLLQTAYTHLFGWMTTIEGGELIQIRLGRLICVGIWVCSLALLDRLGRRVMDPIAARAGVTLFALFSYSIANAASFRIDGLLLPLLLTAALLLLRPTTVRVGTAGAVSGLATALSIKAVLWAPALTGILAVGLWNRRERILPVLAGALAGAITFGAILATHAWLIATGGAPPAKIPAGTVSMIGNYMLTENGSIPRWSVFTRSVWENPITWILIFLGLCVTFAELRGRESRRNSILLLWLALPLASVTFYANAFPYAYLILAPTAFLLAGRGFSWVAREGRLRTFAALACLMVATLPLARYTSDNLRDKQGRQREVISAVHRLFNKPVHYIDAAGMVASFPRPLFFMTEFGVIKYRERGKPIVTQYIQEKLPPLLIANRELLELWDGGAAAALDPRLRLLPEDEAVIRATYTHYRDQIYLAGHAWRDVAGGERLEFEIRIPGQYTIVSERPVIVDGQAYDRGATITLAAGPHILRTKTRELDLRVLWGRHVALPSPISSSAL